MREIREIDNSIVYYFEQQFGTIWGSNLEVMDSYPDDLKDLTPPVVAIDYTTIRPDPLELGTEETDDFYYWNVHIFGRKKGERDDITNVVIDLLESGCSILDFSDGTAGSAKGYVNFRDISAKPVFSTNSAPVGVRYHAVVVTKANVTITG